MTTEQNKAIVHHFFEEMDQGNLSLIADELWTPDFAIHFPGMPGPMNRETFQQFTSGFYAAFPGLRHTIEDTVAEGDRVVVRMTIKGVHQGDFQDLPPTGKAINISAINLFHLVNGKIAEQWVDYDGLGMLQQLGVIPAA